VVHTDHCAGRANQVSEVNRVRGRTTTEIEDPVTRLETQELITAALLLLPEWRHSLEILRIDVAR
jgi:hypothetical protein